MFENVDGRTDAGVTGILIAHLGAFGSGELKQEISLKKIFGGSQILTILTQLSDEIPVYSLGGLDLGILEYSAYASTVI